MRRKSIAAHFPPAFECRAVGCLVTCILLFAASHLAAAQSAATDAESHSQSSRLRAGEILTYRVDWGRFAGAATAQLQVVDRRQYFGADAWHFRATLRTASPLRALYPLDDEIDSYASLLGLGTIEYQEHFREFGRPEDTAVAFVVPGQASNAPLPHVIVPAGTRDALSAIFFLRLTDWNAVSEVRTPVFDGEDIHEMDAVRRETETVQVAAGSFTATKLSIRLLDSGREIPGEHFTLWLASDSAQTPLLCEATLALGSLHIELISDSSWQANNRSARVPSSPPVRSSPPGGN